MKLLVPVKRVVDYNVKVRVKADGSGVETQGVKMSMNPFDEIAVEEVGPAQGEGGRDRDRRRLHGRAAIRRDDPHGACHGRRPRHPGRETDVELQPLAVAKMLNALVDKEQPGLVMGKQAIDDDMNATGQMLAALLGWSTRT